jgi:hypothetical protein
MQTKKAVRSMNCKEWDRYDDGSMFSCRGKMLLQRLPIMILGTRVEDVNVGRIHNKEDKVNLKYFRMDNVHSSCIMITKKPMPYMAEAVTHTHENRE